MWDAAETKAKSFQEHRTFEGKAFEEMGLFDMLGSAHVERMIMKVL